MSYLRACVFWVFSALWWLSYGSVNSNVGFTMYIYFSCHFLSLRPLDVEFMRRLSKVVNIVPVIAKADTLTLEERDFFKKKVSSNLTDR